ncbi:SO_0444 family Cu/Zn efflux transporter [Colwellia sp. RSH04]|uniref:SO_0444 family Cu/Zn efflux transporter n=1 Tax=Colwellia sp. RSH04 TaxID=2305464 RepID=UPI000E593AE0|nr:SO_0444 family Cu/Zn efflux transporter [Colwellia sp. RSH04]RHW74716.1 permease [Colwellia sp. RSH04]
MQLISNFWQLFVLSAPWLMLGLFIAGIINVYLPKDFLNKHLGSDGLFTTIKAAIIGAPMPLCSCGVIPAALGLRRAGASKSATTAFLVSTPETGVDSISVSYVLLGPFMAIIRPIAAITSAIVAGVLVGKDKEKETLESNSALSNETEKLATCCSNEGESTSNSAHVTEKIQPTGCCNQQENIENEASTCGNNGRIQCNDEASSPEKETNCCDIKEKTEKESSCCNSKLNEKSSMWQRMKQAVAFSCTKLLSDTAKWLLIGLVFAAIIQTYVPVSFFSQWGSGILAMLVVILISIPMYVCATASTPIAAGLLLSGVSPGAVLVFMLAGPATNIATLGVVGSELGKRAVFSYLTGVIGVAVLFGFLTDMLVAHYNFSVAPMIGEHHEVLPHWLSQGSAILLVFLLLRVVFLHFKKP